MSIASKLSNVCDLIAIITCIKAFVTQSLLFINLCSYFRSPVV